MNPLFSLSPSERGPIVNIREQELNTPFVISLAVSGLSPLVQKGNLVSKGQMIASGTGSKRPAIHSSISGKVLDVKKDFITIEEEGDRISEPLDFPAVNSKTMLKNLHNAGINTRGLKPECTLIINAVPAEAGIDGHRFLIEEFNHIMLEGLGYLKKAIAPKACSLAIPKGMNWTLAGCTGHEIAPVYPNGLAPMIVKAVTGQEMPADVCVIDAATLYRIGRTVHGNQPVSEIMVKVGATLFQAPVGTRVGLLARTAGFKLADHDRVILGGPLSGEAVYTLNHGVGPETQAVTIIAGKPEPTIKDTPCIGCGECVIKCPARIMPNMISRHAEFGLFENTLNYGIGSCFECGLCTYWCTAQRPILQYIRLAKKELSSQPILEDLRK
ncbi:4Fe-4S dicluster domain-containing protein [Maridesulfovibrio hydrothermalis]|uniref:Putative Electron transport complex protein RnfC n=1 Tax=Maridesulfovibrio hydrothermalis AM13 = DSM 14728 TaxID=1121451 RepID=L0RGL7_9BACT|nr:4Fe-4S dicluster domain-containing protein [Maridesulfovibrio hydrothermalis]CCO24726.1 putative Electron transport complex protein RnfC [Maridesulfovibrio hydrothermalis AM13 = DSM 14728]